MGLIFLNSGSRGVILCKDATNRVKSEGLRQNEDLAAQGLTVDLLIALCANPVASWLDNLILFNVLTI